MKLSEHEAKQTACPYRGEKAKCLASGCMAWIWIHPDRETSAGSDRHIYATVGYCGRVGL